MIYIRTTRLNYIKLQNLYLFPKFMVSFYDIVRLFANGIDHVFPYITVSKKIY